VRGVGETQFHGDLVRVVPLPRQTPDVLEPQIQHPRRGSLSEPAFEEPFELSDRDPTKRGQRFRLVLGLLRERRLLPVSNTVETRVHGRGGRIVEESNAPSKRGGRMAFIDRSWSCIQEDRHPLMSVIPRRVPGRFAGRTSMVYTFRTGEIFQAIF
jgi:hypothetical protein